LDSDRHHAGSVVLGVASGTLLIALYLALTDGATPPARGEVAKQRFVAARSDGSQRATAVGLVNARPSPRPVVESAKAMAPTSRINPLQAQAAGDQRWEATAFTLDDLFWLREQRLQCAHDHALPLRATCIVDYAMVIEPTEVRGRGKIADGEIATSPMGVFDERDEAACAAYAGCLLDARIGESIPIPDEQRDPFIIDQPVAYEWAAASLFDPVHVRELIASYESTVAATPASLFEKLEKNQLDYLRIHLDALSEVED
jgi:hypothetical protein